MNFRESLVCPYCQLNNRQRIVARLILDQCTVDSNIYLTEQVTPFYGLLKKQFPNLVGSEYLGKGITREDIRNEDLTGLSFLPEKFEVVVSNDVFEHVGDIEKDLCEIHRGFKKRWKVICNIPDKFFYGEYNQTGSYF